jgi:hypothetical protein
VAAQYDTEAGRFGSGCPEGADCGVGKSEKKFSHKFLGRRSGNSWLGAGVLRLVVIPGSNLLKIRSKINHPVSPGHSGFVALLVLGRAGVITFIEASWE